MVDEKQEEKQEEKDDIDEFLDSLPDNDGDEPGDKEEDKNKDSGDGEDDKPLTAKDFKLMMEELKVNNQKGVDAETLKQLKEEIRSDFQKQLEPILKTAKQTEFKKSIEDWEKKAQTNLPHFELDMDLLEYHMTMGKSKKEAFAIQVDKERVRAEKYGVQKQEEEKNEVQDVDLKNFDPTLHKEKDFRKMSKEQKDKYWIQFNLFKRKQK